MSTSTETNQGALPAPGGLAALKGAAGEAAGLLRALANPDRLLLLCQLVDGEQCVSELAERTGVLQPTLSQQLGVLRDERLVATRRDGKYVRYRVASADAIAVLRVLHTLYCPAPGAFACARPPSPTQLPEN